VVTISVSPQALAAGQYQGTVSFTGATSAQVTVALTVLAPANLTTSTSTLAFTATTGQSPNPQTIVLQNTGGVSLNWTASVATNTGNWLSPGVSSGTLNSGGTASVPVSVSAATLKQGTYQGTVVFSSDGATRDVSVVFSVTAPLLPVISTSTNSLNFSTTAGTNPAAQTVILTNSGNAPLNWGASANTGYVSVNPSGGTLAAGHSTTLTVYPNISNAGAGTLSTTITLADSDSGTAVKSQQIAVKMTILNQPSMSLSSNSMTLDAASNYPQVGSFLTITDNGSKDLNWQVKPDASAPWLTVDTSSGTTVAGGSTILNVQADSRQLAPGTYTATLTLSDSDAGSPVPPQTVQVTFTVS
jgi:hypothetical protein